MKRTYVYKVVHYEIEVAIDADGQKLSVDGATGLYSKEAAKTEALHRK